MYNQINFPNGDLNPNIVVRSDGTCIPADTANTDYANYLIWLSEGNEPEPADPIPEPVAPTPPTAAELMAQLTAIQAQITALGVT